MEDTGLIVQVYPSSGGDDLAIRAIETNPRCRPPRVPQARARYANLGDDLDSLPYVEHRFQDAHQGSSAIVYGRDPNTCDVVLPSLKGISRHHFALTYRNDFPDGYARLVVRDLGSSWGTKVTYDGEGGEQRSNFDWIISGFEHLTTTESIIVQPNNDIKFRLVVARHDIASCEYNDSVQQFFDGTTSLSGAAVPVVKNPIILCMGWLAQGAFGAVSRNWNVSTGEEYACKMPLGQGYDRQSWVQEIRILQSLSHDHIVRLCFARTEPDPVMFLEYIKFGNLNEQYQVAPFSHDECLVILRQSLLALSYLHDQPQPVAHRDIKPENILIKHRDPSHNPNFLHVKLADFGLSKTSTLKTYCGTRAYLSPEVQREAGSYTKAVDVWSLGVVLLRFAYGLPQPGTGEGLEWCKAIVREVNRLEPGGLAGILQHMLVMEPQTRFSATACLEEVSMLLLSSQGSAASPVPSANSVIGQVEAYTTQSLISIGGH